jgi:glyoxylase-like metal-dependent hydrolase (beta-lactamase superfamily II)
MKIITFRQNEAEENSYLLIDREQALVIDPGFNGEAIEQELQRSHLMLEKVLLTHGHFDHIRDLQLLGKNRSFPVCIHPSDQMFLSDNQLNYSSAFQSTFILPDTIRVVAVSDHGKIAFGQTLIELHHTPGHTAGSACYSMNHSLFTGDTLFVDSIGRTDLATGNRRQMACSLKLFPARFSREMRVYPGHGEPGILKDILLHNPFLSQ